MIIKRKNYDYELTFEADTDFGFWALPCSICWVKMDDILSLKYEFVLLLRFLCFQISLDIWKWDKGWIDAEYTNPKEALDGK